MSANLAESFALGATAHADDAAGRAQVAAGRWDGSISAPVGLARCETRRVGQALAYASVDGGSVALRRLDGASRRTIVYLQTGTIPFELIDDDVNGRRVLRALRALGDVTLFDRRGIGLSDPLPPGSAHRTWAADLIGVIEATASSPVVVFAQQFMDFVLLALADRPDLVESVIWYEPTTDWATPDQPDAVHDLLEASVRGESDFMSVACPTRRDDPAFRSWFNDSGARGASPSVARRLYERADETAARQLRRIAQGLSVPVLILRRPESLSGLRTTLPDDSIFGSGEVVQLAGRDWHLHGERLEDVMNAAARYVQGGTDTAVLRPERALAAVLFTDIVDSTVTSAAVGDRQWKQLIDRHDTQVTAAARSAGGRMIKSTGDGALAMLPSAQAAIEAYDRIRTALRADRLVIRAGIHVGDIDVRGDDISGLAVTAAARIMNRAGPDQLLVSESVVMSMLGTDTTFHEAEAVSLKGLPGPWSLYERIERIERIER